MISFVTYIVAGFVQTAWISLAVGVVLMIGALMVIRLLGNTVTES